MKNRYLWSHESYTSRSTFQGTLAPDYLIVGGGISGLFTAYYLLEYGAKNIALIEKNTIGSGSTGQSAGMLVTEIETASWHTLVKMYGLEHAQLYIQAQQNAQHVVRKLIHTERIACEYNEEYLLYLARTKKEWEAIQSEKEEREALGEHIHDLEGADAQKELASASFVAMERIEMSPSVNPLAFAQGMAHYLEKKGVLIYEHTEALSVEGNCMTTHRGHITAQNIIYAIGVSESKDKIKNILTTICVTRILTLEELHTLRLDDKDMFLETMQGTSYHYGKVTHDNRLLLGFGDDEYFSDTEEVCTAHVISIRDFLDKELNMPHIPFEYIWSSPFALSHHMLPCIEKNGPVATIGGAGTQMASAAIAEYIAAKYVTGTHPLDVLFSKYCS